MCKYSNGTRMYINTCVTQRIIYKLKKILPYCYVKPQQNGHPLHQNRPGISICWKCWVRTCDTSKPCLFTFSTAILHTWSKDQVRNQTIPKIRTTLCVIQQLCILKVQKHSTYLQHQHTHKLFWLLSDLVPPHRCQIRCTRSDMLWTRSAEGLACYDWGNRTRHWLKLNGDGWMESLYM